jgi:hypothetical protein
LIAAVDEMPICKYESYIGKRLAYRENVLPLLKPTQVQNY